MIVMEREAETQAEGEVGSMHCESNMGFHPRAPGSRHGPKAGAKPLCHPGIPRRKILNTTSRKKKELCKISEGQRRAYSCIF